MEIAIRFATVSTHAETMQSTTWTATAFVTASTLAAETPGTTWTTTACAGLKTRALYVNVHVHNYWRVTASDVPATVPFDSRNER